MSYRKDDMVDDIVSIERYKRSLLHASPDFESELSPRDNADATADVGAPHIGYNLPDFQCLLEGDVHCAKPSIQDSACASLKPIKRQRSWHSQILQANSEHICVPEALFSPLDIGLPYPGVHELVAEALLACDPELWQSFCNRIILTGGGANLPGLRERLEHELRTLLPEHLRFCVATLQKPEYGNFRGAAMFAASPEFGAFCRTRVDWLEQGHRRDRVNP